MQDFFRKVPLVAVLALALCIGPASAVDADIRGDAPDVDALAPLTSDTAPEPEDPAPEAPVEAPIPEEPVDDPAILSDDLDPVTVYSPIEDTERERTPLQDAVSALLGEYQPRTYTVTSYLPDGSIVTSTEYVPGLAGLDWSWLSGAALFSLSLYCIFRMIGGVLKWS